MISLREVTSFHEKSNTIYSFPGKHYMELVSFLTFKHKSVKINVQIEKSTSYLIKYNWTGLYLPSKLSKVTLSLYNEQSSVDLKYAEYNHPKIYESSKTHLCI